MYQKNIENGYIKSIVKGVYNGNISESEYNQIMSIINNRPITPEGYDYLLKDNLTWELVQNELDYYTTIKNNPNP